MSTTVYWDNLLESVKMLEPGFVIQLVQTSLFYSATQVIRYLLQTCTEFETLFQESEMPMEELLAMYGYGKGGGRLEEGTEQPSSSVHQGDVVSNSEEDMAPGEIAADGDSPKVGPGESAENAEDHDKSNSEERGSNVQFHTATLLTCELLLVIPNYQLPIL